LHDAALNKKIVNKLNKANKVLRSTCLDQDCSIVYFHYTQHTKKCDTREQIYTHALVQVMYTIVLVTK